MKQKEKKLEKLVAIRINKTDYEFLKQNRINYAKAFRDQIEKAKREMEARCKNKK